MLNSNSDIIGLQETGWKKAVSGNSSLDWFNTLGDEDTAAGLTAAGYTCVKGDDIYGGANSNRTMYNPIYFKTDKYDLIATDTLWFTDAEHRHSVSRIDGANTDKALNYVVLEDKETGVRFIYVNVHLIVKDQDNYVHDAEGNDTEHLVQELQIIYLREILEDLQEQYDLPMIIGGDFNHSASRITTWFNKSVVADDGRTIDSNGKPTETVKVINVIQNAENVEITAPSTSTIENDNFETRKDYTGGPIDLWFVANFEGIMHGYILDDNKNETTGKYPSDHLPATFIVTLYSEKTN